VYVVATDFNPLLQHPIDERRRHSAFLINLYMGRAYNSKELRAISLVSILEGGIFLIKRIAFTFYSEFDSKKK
ncbi:MAG: hypothetical protein ABI760_07225, partial [Ferruginibacter sp.]